MRSLLILLAILLLVIPAQAGPLRFFVPSGPCPNCPGGVCPVVEVPVTAEVVNQKQPVMSDKPTSQSSVSDNAETPEKEPMIDEAARRLAKGGLKPAEEKKLAKIVDAPHVAKALAGHYGPGTCAMLGCATHPEQWIPNGVETQEQLDARTMPWGNGGGFRPFRFFRGRR